MVLCRKVGKGSRQNGFLSSRKGLAEREVTENEGGDYEMDWLG
jgi:hypothetical protein